MLNKLENIRNSLLDMSMRNRLLNFRASTGYSIPIMDEIPDEVYRILVNDGKSMTFLPAPENPPEEQDGDLGKEGEAALGQPGETGRDPAGMHQDGKLQTFIDDKALQARLNRIATNAGTVLGEQGVDCLYLAIGFLEWFESESSKELREAPLILVPVELSRDSAVSRYKLSYSGEDVDVNLSLKMKLLDDFEIDFPDIDATDDDFKPCRYFKEVRSSIEKHSNWNVTDKIVLGFFSFGKLMMYLDLQPENWPEERTLERSEIVKDVITGTSYRDYELIPESDDIDKHVVLSDCRQVLDADASQVRAILEVNKGNNVVIQGPPGTGKSQTIANIIAESLARKKKVLFVSEKMAALDVVKNRLSEVGLGDVCLELHSHKVKPGVVTHEIERVLNQQKPGEPDPRESTVELESLIKDLTDYSEALHKPVGKRKISAFKALGHLDNSRASGVDLKSIQLDNPVSWNKERYDALIDTAEILGIHAANIGTGEKNPWSGVQRTQYLGLDTERFVENLKQILKQVSDLKDIDEQSAAYLCMKTPGCPEKTRSLMEAYDYLLKTPECDYNALASSSWQDKREEIFELISRGREAQHVDLVRLKYYLDAVKSGKYSFDTAIEIIHRVLVKDEPGQADANDSEHYISIFEYLSGAPSEDQDIYSCSYWTDEPSAIKSLIEAGQSVPEVDIEGLKSRFETITRYVNDLPRINEEIADTLGIYAPGTSVEFVRLANSIHYMSTIPEDKPIDFTGETWLKQAGSIDELLRQGRALKAMANSLYQYIPVEQFFHDIDEFQPIIEQGDSKPGLTAQKYKKAIRSLEELCPGGLPGSQQEIVELLNRWRYARRMDSWIESREALGRGAFGSLWQGVSSDWDRLGRLADWMFATIEKINADELPADALQIVNEVERDKLDSIAEAMKTSMTGFEESIADLADFLELEESDRPEDHPGKIALYKKWSETLDKLNWDDSREQIGREAFGSLWNGVASNWGWLKGVADWMFATVEKINAGDLPADALQILNKIERDKLSLMATAMRTSTDEFDESFEELARFLGLGDAEWPRDRSEKIALYTKWAEILDTAKWMESHEALGRGAFGSLWQGVSSDWDRLGRLADWMFATVEKINAGDLPADAFKIINKNDSIKLSLMAAALEASITEFDESIDELTDFLKIDWPEALGKPVETAGYETLTQFLSKCNDAVDKLPDWIRYQKAVRQCTELGLEGVVAFLEKDSTANNLKEIIEFNYYSSIWDEARSQYPVLDRLERESHDQLVVRFRELDKELLTSSRQQLAARMWEMVPRRFEGSRSQSEMGLLIKEVVKRRHHMPLRTLMEKAGHAIQEIKPCFLMSPMSIAKLLRPDSVAFDLLIIDEAGQVNLHDAIGALARCRQVVVAGDSRQLPPTSFFDRISTEDELEPDEQVETDAESILHMCSRVYPTINLRTHYRSRNESLIAFSNHEYYKGKLVTFPGPNVDDAAAGLHFNYVENSSCDRDGSGKNLAQAKRIAERIMAHASMNRDLSLGVGTFGFAQQEAIMDELEKMRRENPEHEEFFRADTPEPFFIKSVENIQGDERDVIFISVGYGPDRDEDLSMSLGPLNSAGGWHRLNVLITRARLSVEIFTSIRPEDIDVDRTSTRGVVALKNYLQFAETGRQDAPDLSDEETGVEFRESVLKALTDRGYEADPEVGMSDYYVDIAVRDPEHPGRYLVGIVCDGAAYNSARSARERDRLRPEVLEDLGWTVYRVWSTDWFNSMEKEIDQVIAAIDEAKSKPALSHRDKDFEKAPGEEETARPSEAKEEIASSSAEISASPYKVADDSVVKAPACDNPADAPVDEVALFLSEIVDYEGPIHIEELTERAAEIWGLKHASRTFRALVKEGIEDAVSSELLARKGDFIWPPDMSEPPIRDRSDDDVIKKSYLIPPEEIMLAASRIEDTHAGIPKDDLVAEIAHTMGIQLVGPDTKSYIGKCLENGKER